MNLNDMAEVIQIMILAQLQAQGRTLADVNDDERQKLIDEAIEDLMLVDRFFKK